MRSRRRQDWMKMRQGIFAFCEKIALEGTKAVAELLDAQTKETAV